MGCFSTILLIILFIFVIISMIRWFEQIAQAVDNGWWNKVTVLTFMPFTVWFYPSSVSTGRPTPVPHHEPVRGFGTGPTKPSSPAPSDQAPPGTPKEFLELPKIPPPKPKSPKPAADPDKIARLKQKMREQGMLPPEE